MTIFITSDHAGFKLKNILGAYLADHGYMVIDRGPEIYDSGDDYPDFAFQVAEDVARDPHSARGIVIGGSGQGEAMAANRVKGIRAAVYYGGKKDIIRLSREHNDANILSFGARFVDEDEAKQAAVLWLETQFSGDARHVRRIRKLDSR